MPPLAVTETLEVPPKHRMLDGLADKLMFNNVGCVIIILLLDWHPLLSVTVTVYVFADNPVLFCVVCPPFQRYVYGDVPPLGVMLIDPVDAPLQSTFTWVDAMDMAVG